MTEQFQRRTSSRSTTVQATPGECGSILVHDPVEVSIEFDKEFPEEHTHGQEQRDGYHEVEIVEDGAESGWQPKKREIRFAIRGLKKKNK